MCTVELVVYVRQQTVQHTPVKLKDSYLTLKTSCVNLYVKVGDMGLESFHIAYVTRQCFE